MKVLYVVLLLLSTFPVVATERPLRVVTYNIKCGLLTTIDSLADEINGYNPDFVALQEVDVYTDREKSVHTDVRNFVSELAYKTGMFAYYSKSIDFSNGYYGIAILSRYPASAIKRILLPNPENAEQRSCLIGEFEIGDDVRLVFANTHLDVESDSTRMLQLNDIDNVLKSYNCPIVLCGDLNAEPEACSIIDFNDKGWNNVCGSQFTFPSDNPDRKIDYIYINRNSQLVPVSSFVPSSGNSDHRPIVSELYLIEK